MPVEFVDFDQAREAAGLRMVVVPGTPSPWGEAAKGILHVKQIPWKAVRLEHGNAEMVEWAGQQGGPVAVYEDEPPRSGWVEILLLAERLAPAPALVPADASLRAEMFGLAHELCGEQGLGWVRRLEGVHAGLQGGVGFPKPIAGYLASKYGYRAEEAEGYSERVQAILRLFAGRLTAQRAAGSQYYLGESLTALDIYAATFMALLDPLPQAQCPMDESFRAVFRSLDEGEERALDPILLEHRDFVYSNHLELPLSL